MNDALSKPIDAARKELARRGGGLSPRDRRELVLEYLEEAFGLVDEEITGPILAAVFNPAQRVTAAREAERASKIVQHTREKRPAADPGLIKAPYRFITLQDRVATPEADNPGVHDVPLPRGLCAQITLTWRAETPILIGGPATAKSEEGLVEPLALGGGASYVIPGATIRGMIRAACEIVGLAKLGAANLHHRYGLREFKHPYYAGDAQVTVADKVKAGFLSLRDDTYFITPAASWGLVPIDKIGSGVPKWAEQDLTDKYAHLGMKKGDTPDFSVAHELQLVGAKMYEPRAGGTAGVLVVSGKLPGGGNKRYEYCVFRDPAATPIAIDADRAELFQRLNGTPNKNKMEPAGSWKLLKPVAEIADVPVFYVGDLAPGRQQTLAFGLTRLFKIPHRQSVGDVLAAQANHIPTGDWATAQDGSEVLTAYHDDFVERLFGYVVEAEDLKLIAKKASVKPSAVARKGRVAFSLAHLDTETPAKISDGTDVIQMAPRASFAPFYLAANGAKDYSANEARLAGRKAYFPRYPQPAFSAALADMAATGARQIEEATKFSKNKKEASKKARSRLRFLVPKGNEPLRFKSEIHLHNVTPAELGLILYVLTHGGDPANRHRFMIGRGKPFGAGQFKLEELKLTADPNKTSEPAMATGAEIHDASTGTGWCPPEGHSLKPFFDAFVAHMSKTERAYPDIAPVREWLAMALPEIGAELAKNGKLDYQTVKNMKTLREQTQALREPADEPLPQYRLLGAPDHGSITKRPQP